MNYKKYQKARDAAWQILLDAHIKELPVKAVNLCHRMGISVRMFDGAEENDGYSMILNSVPVIFVNKNKPVPRQRFTVAHELGHIVLGHVGKYELINREPSPSDNSIEQEANVFAARLLAPACVLHEARAFTAERIAELCEVSQTFAKFRLERLLLLEAREREFLARYGHGCFYLSPLERKVAKRFKKYIETLK